MSVPTARTVVVALTMLSAPVVAGAHHSFAVYSDEVTEVAGELVEVYWGNPHVRLTMSSAEAGQAGMWTLDEAREWTAGRSASEAGVTQFPL